MCCTLGEQTVLIRATLASYFLFGSDGDSLVDPGVGVE